MSNTEKQVDSISRGFLSCRQILSMLTMLGFMVNYALRVNLSIAIVDMVVPNATEVPTIDVEEERFNWDNFQISFLHSSFYCGYILTELPGGRLAEMIGGHRVLGHSMLWASVLTLITPMAAHIHYSALIIVRVLLGFMLGASWPAILPVAAVWIPPNERSKFMSNMMASSLGAAITMPICGFIISMCGWSSAFYFTGALGLLWSFCWFTLVFETPAVHPRISPKERREIEEAIGTTTAKKHSSYMPWGQLMTSPPVWAIILTHGLSVFGFFTVVTQLPTFMNKVLVFDIKKNGLYSALPYLGKYIMAVSSAYLADYMLKRGNFSKTAIRKMFTSFALISPGLLMIAQVFLGKSAGWTVTIFTLALFAHGAVTAGYLGNGLDIAPNFSGTIFGMANTLSSCGGFLSNFMVSSLVTNQTSFDEWKIVFWILSATYISSALIFVIFGTGKLQPWNNPPFYLSSNIIASAEEGVPLKEKEKDLQ